MMAMMGMSNVRMVAANAIQDSDMVLIFKLLLMLCDELETGSAVVHL